MVGAGDRQPMHAADQRRRDARRAGRAEVQHAVAAFGQRLDDRGQRRHADLQPGVERDLDLGDRAQAAVDVRVGADHLDLEAGHAALADLVDRVRDAVHPADAVGDQRDPHRLALARRELALLAPEEGGGGRVGDRGEAGREDAPTRRRRSAPGRRPRVATARSQPALVDAPRAALEVGVREAVGLEEGEQVALAHAQVDRVEPRAQQGLGVLGTEVAADRAAAGVALRHHALDHPQDRRRVRCGVVAIAAARARGSPAPSRRAPTWRPSPARRARSTRPARTCARNSAGVAASRRLRPGAADVDARVVVAAADADPAVRLDVDRGRVVELARARAVADLPDRRTAARAGAGGAACSGASTA